MKPDMNITGADISFGKFTCASGETIPASDFEYKWVDHVHIVYPSNAYGWTGETPDILQTKFPIDSESGRNLSFWITVNVPRTIPAGEYYGEIFLKTDQLGTQNIPLKIRIRNFSLPETPSFGSVFLVWGDSFSSKKGLPALSNMEYIRDMEKQKTTGIYDIPVAFNGTTIDRKAFSEEIDMRINKLHASKFCIGGVFQWRKFSKTPQLSSEVIDSIKNFTRETSEVMKEKNCMDKVWWLMADEVHNQEIYMNHLRYIDIVKSVAPELPIAATINHPAPELAAKADQLCSSISVFEACFMNNPEYKQKEFWLYDNGTFFCTDVSTCLPRSIAWLSYKHGIKGYHQWSVICWPENFTTGFWNGDGFLYYPLNKDDRNIPKRSIRLEMFRKSVEDYEYIKILEKEIKTAKEKGLSPETIKVAETCLKKCISKIIKGDFGFTENISDFYEAREKLSEQIENLNSENRTLKK